MLRADDDALVAPGLVTYPIRSIQRFQEQILIHAALRQSSGP